MSKRSAEAQRLAYEQRFIETDDIEPNVRATAAQLAKRQ